MTATPTPEEQLVALAGELERVSRNAAALRADLERVRDDMLLARQDQAETVVRVRGLAEAVSSTLETVDGMRQAVARVDRQRPGPLPSWLCLGPPGGPDGGPRDLLTPEQATARVHDLAAWLADVYLRWPDGRLPSCWAWHPWVLEELWALRMAHHEAYATGVAARVVEWHDRARPGVARRINEHLRTCDLTRHEGAHDQTRPAAPLAEHLTAVADAWLRGSAPVLTPAMRAAAAVHEDAQVQT